LLAAWQTDYAFSDLLIDYGEGDESSLAAAHDAKESVRQYRSKGLCQFLLNGINVDYEL
jgi:hypothetical protein